MAADIIVDSNVYIDLLRASRDPIEIVGEWSGTRNLAICGMIRMEVLRGVKTPRSYQKIANFMDVMIHVQTNDSFWDEAAALAWQLDRKGKVIPSQDIIIATCAMRLGAAILTSDAHFLVIDGLEVITPPTEWFS